MRILIISNLYPPLHVGGYELGCRDIVQELKSRGHEVIVLCSDYQCDLVNDEEVNPEIRRILFLATKRRGRILGKIREIDKVYSAVRDFSPDIVYFWNLAGLSLWISLIPRLLGIPSVFFLSDTNFTTHRIGAVLGPEKSGEGFVKSLSRRFIGNDLLTRGWPIHSGLPCHFASAFLQELGMSPGTKTNSDHSQVIHWGIDPLLFEHTRIAPRDTSPNRLLYAGQLIPQKGVHTAIQAFAKAVEAPGCEHLTLSIAGGGPNLEYQAQLVSLVAKLHLNEKVRFLGSIPRADLPGVYASHDILIFPSEWEEPFAITPLEAMASGLAVIGTITGGSGEIFKDRENALVYKTGDSEECARLILELCRTPELFRSIRKAGRDEVIRNYTLHKMVNQIETSLCEITNQKARV